MFSTPSDARSSIVRLAGYVLGMALLTFVSIALTRSQSWGAGLLWPVNAVAAGVLLARPTRAWPVWAGATAAAIVTINVVVHKALVLPVGFTAINMAEILLVAIGVQRTAADVRTLKGYFTIVGVALAATAICAAAGATLLSAVGAGPIVPTAERWFAANGLGMLILLPILRAMASRQRGALTVRRMMDAALVPVAVTIVTVITFRSNYSMLFLLMPCGVFAAFRQRFLGAVVAIASISVVATLFTMHGDGPIATSPGTRDRLLYLQMFLAAVALTTFPVATLLDQRRRALITIRDAEQQLRLLTDNSTDMIVRITPDGIRRYVSPASFRLLGYHPEDLVGVSPIAMIHPDDRDRVERTCRSLLDGATEPVATYRQRHRDGHYIWVEAAYRLVEIDGRPREMLASVRDISRRHAAEQNTLTALAQLKDRQRMLTMAEATAQIGHWRLNFADNSVFWSPEVFHIHGLSVGNAPHLDESIGWYHPDDRATVRTEVQKAMDHGTGFRFVARILRADGAVRWVESRGQAERAVTGEVIGLFGVFHDITEQVTALGELTEAREAAERALEAKAVFTATMSHEIRTPLTSILAVTDLLRDTTDPDEQAKHLNTLTRSGRILSDIIDDVLIFSKLEAGQVTVESVAFDLRTLLDDVAMLFAAEAASRDVSIAIAIEPGAQSVTGDPVCLRRVLTNLVGNAVKFTREGRIDIAAAPSDDGSHWRFEVADTGVGIRGDRLEAIFEPFVQADASTTRSYGGTGLGLNICRMLVDAMDGEIGVDSAPGAGSRFWFVVPLGISQAPSTVDGGVPGQDDPPHACSLRVMVAEDNETNRYLIGELVRRLGHQVVAVENGARAVEGVTDPAGGGIDLVLMDIQMPVMDGIAATRAIRAWSGAGAHLPIHALTADLSSDRRAAIYEAGIDGILAKPVDLDALRQVLDGIVPVATVVRDEAQAIIDQGRIDALGETLGVASRAVLLRLLINDARAAPDEIRRMSESGALRDAKMRAHGLRGAAAGVGAVALTDVLREAEAAFDDGNPAEPDVLTRLTEAAAAVVATLTPVVEGDGTT